MRKANKFWTGVASRCIPLPPRQIRTIKSEIGNETKNFEVKNKMEALDESRFSTVKFQIESRDSYIRLRPALTLADYPACARPLFLRSITPPKKKQQMIEPVADQLSIPRGNIFANSLRFDGVTGEYTGFDADEPTSRDGGKPKVIGL